MTDNTRNLILVVDDDVDLLAAIRECLEFDGYEVATALNGEEGLKKLEEISPHLIILDMNMPGMGGFPFLREMGASERLSGIPVLVFTARANLEEFFEGVNVAGFMSKPCEPDALLREVKRIIAERRGSVAAPRPAASVSGKRLLLAEEDGGRREALLQSFSAAGYEVTAVSRGTNVLEKIVLEKPDVIVMRLIMEGMNGDAVTLVMDSIPEVGKTPVVLYEDSGAIPRERATQVRKKTAGLRKFVKSSRAEDLIESVKLILEMHARE